MALGRCQDCREPMSDSAESCPHCGSTRRPVTFVKRKKIIAVHCRERGGEDNLYFISYESNHYLQKRGWGFPSGWMGWGQITYSRRVKREDIDELKEEILSKADDHRKFRIIGVTKALCGCRGKKEAEIEFSEEVEL